MEVKASALKVLIVDDEPLARERLRDLLTADKDIGEICEARNGREAVEQLLKNQPDILFLDVQMPHLTGFQVLEKLGAEIISRIPVIIFATAYDKYALRAFEFHALDYLLKPFPRERFRETLDHAKKSLQRAEQTKSPEIIKLLESLTESQTKIEWFTVKKNDRIVPYRAADVQWIEASANYAVLRFGETTELVRETMENLEKQLDSRVFIRINRSTIVNINSVREIQMWFQNEHRVILKNGKDFALTATYRDKFMKFFKKNF